MKIKEFLYFIMYNIMSYAFTIIFQKDFSDKIESIAKFQMGGFYFNILITNIIIGILLILFIREYKDNGSNIIFIITLVFSILTILISFNISPKLLALLNRNVDYVRRVYLIFGAMIATKVLSKKVA